MGVLDDLKTKNQMNIGNMRAKNAVVKSQNASLSTLNSGSSLAKLNNSMTSHTELESRIQSYQSSMIDQTSKQLQENSKELIFILDRSNSCSGLEKATSRGYDQLIEKEKRSLYPSKVTTVLFDDRIDEICFRQDLSKITTLKYKADGNTRLYDAFCSTIKKVKSARVHDTVKPSKTLVAIMTDGEDNRSYLYNATDMQNMIQQCKSEGWEFIYLGALENAQQIAMDLGIDFSHSIECQNTVSGMLANFDAISHAIDDITEYGKVTPNWTKSINNLTEEDKPKQKRIGARNG